MVETITKDDVTWLANILTSTNSAEIDDYKTGECKNIWAYAITYLGILE